MIERQLRGLAPALTMLELENQLPDPRAHNAPFHRGRGAQIKRERVDSDAS